MQQVRRNTAKTVPPKEPAYDPSDRESVLARAKASAERQILEYENEKIKSEEERLERLKRKWEEKRYAQLYGNGLGEDIDCDRRTARKGLDLSRKKPKLTRTNSGPSSLGGSSTSSSRRPNPGELIVLQKQKRDLRSIEEIQLDYWRRTNKNYKAVAGAPASAGSNTPASGEKSKFDPEAVASRLARQTSAAAINKPFALPRPASEASARSTASNSTDVSSGNSVYDGSDKDGAAVDTVVISQSASPLLVGSVSPLPTSSASPSPPNKPSTPSPSGKTPSCSPSPPRKTINIFHKSTIKPTFFESNSRKRRPGPFSHVTKPVSSTKPSSLARKASAGPAKS